MKKRFGALALIMLLFFTPATQAFAAQLGPAASYEELLSLAASAGEGDTLLIRGELDASGGQPLSADVYVHLVGEEGAAISGLALSNASLSISGITLTDGLNVRGQSHVQLMRGVRVQDGLAFSGSGTLLLDPGTSVTGSGGAPGVSIRHTGGDLYASLDGVIRGGNGSTGGPAAVVDPLGSSGALMITGTLTGGEGEAFGGNALNLHNLSGNAYITIEGRLTGGAGEVGGRGLQLITADGSVTAGLGGQITGGRGNGYGGDAMMLMNVGGSASVALSGALTGGDSSGTDSSPGQSLTLLGQTTAMRTSVGSNCILQDGRQVLYSLAVTPLPAITSSVEEAETIDPTPTPPPAATIEPMPTAEPTIAPTAEPTAEPTTDPTTYPTDIPIATFGEA